jgi:hypothetical protein
VTLEEFNAIKDAEAWPQEKRDAWSHVVPTCNPECFRLECLRPDGIVEVRLIRRSTARS